VAIKPENKERRGGEGDKKKTRNPEAKKKQEPGGKRKLGHRRRQGDFGEPKTREKATNQWGEH
jgi:hypothetical protein